MYYISIDSRKKKGKTIYEGDYYEFRIIKLDLTAGSDRDRLC